YTDDIEWSRNLQDGSLRNVNETERWISAIGGVALSAYGLSRRSWPGLVLAAIGGALVYRGALGHCSVYEALGVSTTDLGRRKVLTDRAVKVEQSIIVNRPADELYRYWTGLGKLPRFIK